MVKEKEGCCRKLKRLFFHPKEFFKTVENEKEYSKILFFYIKIALISIILNLLISVIIILARPSVTSTAVAVLQQFFSSLIALGTAFLTPFVAAGLIHLGVLIVGGKKGYFNTFKPTTYALSITIMYGILSVILMGIIALVAPANTLDQAEILQNPAVIVSMVIYLLIFLISFIHFVIAQIIGSSKFQEISKIKAFLALLAAGIIIALIIVLIFILFGTYLLTPIA